MNSMYVVIGVNMLDDYIYFNQVVYQSEWDAYSEICQTAKKYEKQGYDVDSNKMKNLFVTKEGELIVYYQIYEVEEG